jgi:hypothetical protein
VSVSNVLGEAWELYTRLFVRTVAVAAIVFLVLDLAATLATRTQTRNGSEVLLFSILTILLAVVGPELVQGALAEAVRDAHEGREPASAHALLLRTRPRLFPLVGASLFAGLGIALGFVLLVVPGLVLLTRWSLIAPCVVIEGLGPNAARRRSRELVRGHGWTVFGVLFVTYLLESVWDEQRRGAA